jgi:hypothetical protein
MKKTNPQRGVIEDILIFVGIIVALFIGWVITGGPQREEATQGKFIDKAEPIGTGKVYDEKIFEEGVGDGVRERIREPFQ